MLNDQESLRQTNVGYSTILFIGTYREFAPIQNRSCLPNLCRTILLLLYGKMNTILDEQSIYGVDDDASFSRYDP